MKQKIGVVTGRQCSRSRIDAKEILAFAGLPVTLFNAVLSGIDTANIQYLFFNSGSQVAIVYPYRQAPFSFQA